MKTNFLLIVLTLLFSFAAMYVIGYQQGQQNTKAGQFFCGGE